MKNISFLHAVASAYVESGEDLSDYCFVFPNKRSGTFFLRELSRCAKSGPMLAPQVLAVGDFMQRISGRDVASRIADTQHLTLRASALNKRPTLCLR